MSLKGTAYALGALSLLVVTMLLALWPHQWRSKNAAVLIVLAWSVAGNLVIAINSIMYAELALDAPFSAVPISSFQWCDLSQAVLYASDIGSISAILVLARNLKIITNPQATIYNAPRGIRKHLLAILMGVGLPILMTAIHPVIQGHRINIVEGIGCIMPEYVISIPWLVLFSVPLVISLVAAVYAGFATYYIVVRRVAFAKAIQSHATGISQGHYRRLLALTLTYLLFTLPVFVLIFAFNIKGQPFQVWGSWDYVHSNFNYAYLWSAKIFPTFNLSQWLAVSWLRMIAAYIFFALFGLRKEPWQCYLNLLRRAKIVKPKENVMTRRTIPNHGSRPRTNKESCELQMSSTSKDEDAIVAELNVEILELGLPSTQADSPTMSLESHQASQRSLLTV